MATRAAAPLCFAKEALAAPDFAPESFIADCRRRVPLESLLTDLRAFAATLEHELVELINEDYADFVSLSSNLTGIDRQVSDLRTGLLALRKDLMAVRAAVHGAISEVENKLDEKRHAARKQAALQLMVNTSKTLAKIERLLQGGEGGAVVVLRADEESSNLIERVASDFNQLRFYVSKGKGVPFIEGLTGRIQTIEAVLGEGLVSLFRQALTERDLEQTLNCMRTYAAIERAADAEAVVRVHLVRPALSAIITETRLEGGAKGSCDGLASIFSEVLSFVEQQCTFLLDAALRSSTSPFLFIAHSVWPECVELLVSRLSRIFAPGLPELFHKNYSASMLFLDLFERSSRSRRELLALRASPAYADFMKRWQVNVYFKMRFQEIVRRVEGAFNPSSSRGSQVRASGWALVETEETVEAMRRCWSNGVFLPVLTADFLRLSLQLSARYVSWIEQGFAQNWSSLPPDALPLLCIDARRLSDHLQHEQLREADAAVAGATGSEGRAALHEAHKEAAHLLRELATRVATAAVAPAVRRTVELLAPARMIPSAYRFTGKPAPESASPYVAAALQPLREFFASSLVQLLEQSARAEWTADAATKVTEQYVR